MRAAVLVGLAFAVAGCRTQPIEANDGGAVDLQAVEYRAVVVPTNVPRLSIEKIDTANTRCTTVLLAEGITGMPNSTATLPMGWVIESAWQGPTCAQLAPPNDAALATSASGTIDFDTTTLAQITVHVQLTFPAAAESLDVDNLPVTQP
jgi:hypothetical protein